MTKQSATIFSRRNLLGALAAGGAAAAALAAPALPLSWTRRPGAGSWWDRTGRSLTRGAMQEWRQQIGSTFTVAGDAGTAALTLVAVVPLNSGGRRPSALGRSRAFAAIFETAQGTPPAGDRIYSMEHAVHGKMPVFMTAGRAGAPRLEAVFN